MRRCSPRIAAVLSCCFLLATPPTLTAGDYHLGKTLLCSQCHVMHYSQHHGYRPDGSGFWVFLGGAGPYRGLLRNKVNDLCLSCHDDNGGIAPDVLGVNQGNSPSDIREAGFLNRLGLDGKSPTGHTLDALDQAPGSQPPWKPEDENGAGNGLNCINCHHQHADAGPGNNAYRNLRVDPGTLRGGGVLALVTYNDNHIGTNDLSRDVFERQKADYDESSIDFNEPNSTQSAMGKYCGGCHTNFHGVPGDSHIGGEPSGGAYVEFLRHPSSGVNIGAVGGGHSSLSQYNAHANKVKVMSEVGVWNPAGTDVTATCISCHKAHGNHNAFGLIFRSGTGSRTEDGDTHGGQLEHLCGQCHVQASAFVNP